MKIATWNVNSLKVRLPHLLDWLAANPVDAIGLQETKLQDANFPFDALKEAGWNAVHNGQKTYNGVALLSRHALEEVSRDMTGFEDEQKRVIAATINGVRVVNVYVVNGQSVGSEKYEYKLRWLKALHEVLRDELTRHPQLAVVGDFNIAPAPEDTHDPAVWEGQILCSDLEREHYRNLLALGLSDCLAQCAPAEGRFTWWDYRQAGFRRNLGLRIDHILASAPLAQKLQRCVIDTVPRKLERPSDHAPVITEFSD